MSLLCFPYHDNSVPMATTVTRTSVWSTLLWVRSKYFIWSCCHAGWVKISVNGQTTNELKTTLQRHKPFIHRKVSSFLIWNFVHLIAKWIDAWFSQTNFRNPKHTHSWPLGCTSSILMASRIHLITSCASHCLNLWKPLVYLKNKTDYALNSFCNISNLIQLYFTLS